MTTVILSTYDKTQGIEKPGDMGIAATVFAQAVHDDHPLPGLLHERFREWPVTHKNRLAVGAAEFEFPGIFYVGSHGFIRPT